MLLSFLHLQCILPVPSCFLHNSELLASNTVYGNLFSPYDNICSFFSCFVFIILFITSYRITAILLLIRPTHVWTTTSVWRFLNLLLIDVNLYNNYIKLKKQYKNNKWLVHNIISSVLYSKHINKSRTSLFIYQSTEKSDLTEYNILHSHFLLVSINPT